jgi:hypothetical protein
VSYVIVKNRPTYLVVVVEVVELSVFFLECFLWCLPVDDSVLLVVLLVF